MEPSARPSALPTSTDKSATTPAPSAGLAVLPATAAAGSTATHARPMVPMTTISSMELISATSPVPMDSTRISPTISASSALLAASHATTTQPIAPPADSRKMDFNSICKMDSALLIAHQGTMKIPPTTFARPATRPA
jgi:hypothetical protein